VAGRCNRGDAPIDVVGCERIVDLESGRFESRDIAGRGGNVEVVGGRAQRRDAPIVVGIAVFDDSDIDIVCSRDFGQLVGSILASGAEQDRSALGVEYVDPKRFIVRPFNS